MKKIILLLFFVSTFSHGQSYLAYVINDEGNSVNLRKGPSIDYGIHKSLEPGSNLFVISSEKIGDFYNVIDIESNIEGYMHKSFVRFTGDVIEESGDMLFVPIETTNNSIVSEIDIHNDTDKTIKILIGNNTYSFNPQQKKTLKLSPGQYSYRVSAPGVIPYLGKDLIEQNTNYSWSFYISNR